MEVHSLSTLTDSGIGVINILRNHGILMQVTTNTQSCIFKYLITSFLQLPMNIYLQHCRGVPIENGGGRRTHTE